MNAVTDLKKCSTSIKGLSPSEINNQFNDIVKAQFVKKMTQILAKAQTSENSIINNIWILNQILIPLKNSSRFKYNSPVNVATAYGSICRSFSIYLVIISFSLFYQFK